MVPWTLLPGGDESKHSLPRKKPQWQANLKSAAS